MDLPKLEEKILDFWEKSEIFKKSVEARKGAESFILFDGPPTANALPHIGSALTQVYKDSFPRYKTMRGYYAPRKAGWDTHGLPVELEVEKELGFKSKTDIEKYGVAEFNQKCRENVWKYKAEWEKEIKKIGYWEDLENAYITYDPKYVESLWWIIKQFFEKGLLYKGYKSVPYCPRCGTSLSSHEVAQGYDDNAVDPSVYVKIKLADDEGYFLIWTTTPWTLPSNVALALHPDVDYQKILYKNDSSQEEILILAKQRIAELLKDKKYDVLSDYKGSDLKGINYEPLYDARQTDEYKKNSGKDIYKTILADFVTTEDGTGIVHIAPAFGPEDLEAGKSNNLAFIQFVDEQGNLTFGPKEAVGLFVKESDPKIMADLVSRSLMFDSGEVTHTYPFCWRCSTPLLYYARESWFVKVSEFRDKLLSNNNTINWVPEHLKGGRFGNFLEQAQDWNFSRSRYWGTPLPIWQCASCHEFQCIGSFDELKKQAPNSLPDPFDPHRPSVDEVKIKCDKCGGESTRVPELTDVWFDSGSMPYAQLHYPFENENLFKEMFPGDFISEAVDQTRGWFYTLLAVSTLLEKGAPYKNVVSFYHVLDTKGKKMSKSKGNAISPYEVITEQGADPLRWYLLITNFSSAPKQFSKELVGDVIKGFLNTLWNTYSFFLSYAKIDNWTPENMNTKFIQYNERPLLDRWILSEMERTKTAVSASMDNFDATNSVRTLQEFLDALSNWYIRRSRRRFWKSGDSDDKESAYQTLYKCLSDYNRLLAPFIPFLSEHLFQKIKSASDPESVHLCDWPETKTELLDKTLMLDMQKIREVVASGLALRAKAGVKVRQPLQAVYIVGKDIAVFERELVELATDELNVKNIEFVPNKEALPKQIEIDESGIHLIALGTEITGDLKIEGIYRELVRQVQSLRKKAGYQLIDRINLSVSTKSKALNEALAKFDKDLKEEVLADGVALLDNLPDNLDIAEDLSINGESIEVGIAKSTNE